MKWLNYHHLLYFREIAREGSISKASEKLLVGQPSLSTQLRQLEESLGVLLFERKSRGLVLTEAGKIALGYADEIFGRGEEFLSVFQSKNFKNQSRYRLGAVAGLPKSLVCKTIKTIKNHSPDCFISTFEDLDKDLERRLLAHELDLAITNTARELLDGISAKLIGRFKISVYGAPKFESLIKDFPRSLNGAPFVLQTMHSRLRQEIEQLLHSLKIQTDLVAECQDYAVKKALAQDAQGLVFLPEFAARRLESEGSLVKLGSFDQLFEEYWLLSASKRLKNPITEMLRQEFSI